MGAKVHQAFELCLRHHRVHSGQYLRRIAPGVVAGQAHTLQRAADKALRGAEYLRLGAAKTVNALLGVAHNEHARPGTAARPRVAVQPGRQSLPLQRVGVLKLVNQQVAHGGIQALLHPGPQLRVGQQHQGGTLQIGHVDPAALAFDGGKRLKQHTDQTHQALVVLPGSMLVAGLCKGVHQRLRLPHLVNAHNFFAELARLAFLGEQGVHHTVPVLGTGGLLQSDTFFSKASGAGPRECVGGVQQGLAVDDAAGPNLFWRFEIGIVGKNF